MLSANELEMLIQRIGGADLKHTRVPGVFRIGEPFRPKGAKRVSAIKDELLRILAGRLPHYAICMESHDADLLTVIDHPRSESDSVGKPLWIFLHADDLEKLIPVLYRGVWGLFFSETDSLVSAGPAQLTFNELEAPALTTRVGAAASVFSWYDDVDWLICLVAQGGRND